MIGEGSGRVGSYPKGEQTRIRIVLAALKLFARRGFDGASTRDIAAEAGVRTPALRYYFDSKEGVYLACVEYLASRAWSYLSTSIHSAKETLARNASDEELIEALCNVVLQLAEFLYTSDETASWRLFVALQGTAPEAGARLFYRRIDKPLADVMVGIVARLLRKTAVDDETVIRTAALNGQLLVFGPFDCDVARPQHWQSVRDPTRIRRVIHEQTQLLLRWMVKTQCSVRM